MPLTSPPEHTLITANNIILLYDIYIHTYITFIFIWVPPCGLVFRGCGQQKVVLLLPYTMIIYM